MGKRYRLVLEADSIKLFDALAAVKGDCSGVGERVVAPLMTGQSTMFVDIGLSAYGIDVVSVEEVKDDG